MGKAGRPPGSVNKSTEQFKQFIANFCESRKEQFIRDFDAIQDPEKRASMYIKVMEFHLPKGIALTGVGQVVVTIENKLKELADEEVEAEEVE